MLTLDGIWFYPVKGLRGVSVLEAEVEPWGLKHDRRWMVVDPLGRFLTQRQVSRMAVVSAVLLPGGLGLSAEGAGACEIAVPSADAPVLNVTVWDDVVTARVGAQEAAHWLTGVLGTPCRLVYMADPAGARPCDPDFSLAGDWVSFADGFPLLATTTGSLDDLNRHVSSPVGMDRFRPNIVVGGAAPWAEDHWTRLHVGRVAFSAVKDCARCIVTTVDQATGIKAEDGEPLRRLASFRRKAGGRIIFGQNLVPRSEGRIAVGDPVEAN